MMPAWLNDAIFYEIYPQSFYDSNGDGIGDIPGILEKLDYIRDLGCNALWINPCFDSPFKDAGYDVRDYTLTAPRYGTNDDLVRLFTEAHRQGIRVLLDLVPGHTSEEHPWFRKSREPRRNEYWNRYVWTDRWETWAQGLKTILGEADRNASYIVNFFKSQPALNYGFFNPDQAWQLPMDHPDCIATREAMKDVMRFWLDKGCDGFRVDMASSLVKFDDPENRGTAAIWRDVRAMLDAEYPGAAIIAEWSHPRRAIGAGFHGDFLLAFTGGSGYQSLFRDYVMDAENRIVSEDRSFFKKDGAGDICRFLDEYLPHYEAVKGRGHISLVTGNHDVPRIALNLSPRELALAYAFIFTMPGVPFLYYGDEIGMRYLNLLSKEGGYHRTGSRTPMQWKNGKNKGFSSAPEDTLYLPVDASPDAPTVEAQEQDPASLLNTVKALLALRRTEKDLGSRANLEILYADPGKPFFFIYRRGSFVIGVNPGEQPVEASVKKLTGEPVYILAAQPEQCALARGRCRMAGQSFGIWKIKEGINAYPQG
jgi:maltose alpha-D-glucosyltransferase/alpha-amylase